MNREEALDVALGQIERQFGKGSVMRMSDQAQVSIGAVSTGALSLDMALGIGGLPRGRVVEVFGPESSGKTTLVYHVIAEAQRRGGICAFIDAEHAMDAQYARRIGVNIDDLLVSQPDTGEQALEICELLVRSGAVDVVAIDSVAALVPKAEIEGEMGDSHVGLQARLMGQALRKLAGTLNRTDTICLFTNQLREKIGVMFGSPETTPGGRAMKFYASVRLDIRRIETLKDGAEAYGNRVRVKVVKNKVAPPFKQAEFDIIYGTGISWEGTVLDVGIERKVVSKAGSYFSFGDERLGQGRQNATNFLIEHPDLVQQILRGSRPRCRRSRSSRPGCCRWPMVPPRSRSRRSRTRWRSRPRAQSSRGRGDLRPVSRAELSRARLRHVMDVPVVTALRARGPGRVAVELDGEPWRVVPLEAVYGAGLVVGGPLDRTKARALGRELRRLGAQAVARRALRTRDHTAASLEQRLAVRGTPATVRRDTVEAAQRAGLVDDRRFAMQRAEQLASRGSGDLLIGDDLERQGVPARARTACDRRARAGGRPRRHDRRCAWAEPENGSLPRVAGILGGRARIDRCESGCRRVRIEMLHPTFLLHRAHSENRLSMNLSNANPPTCGMAAAPRRASQPR